MSPRADKILGVIIVLALVGLLFEVAYISLDLSGLIEHKRPIENEENSLAVEEPIEQEESQKETALPESFSLDIPFICQAPLGDWSPPFDHACEEGAILMVHYYLQGRSVNSTEAAQEIREMTDFEKKTYGFYKDSSAEQTAQLIRDYYGYQVKVYYDISLKDIKEELVQGNPVIVPTAGRLLDNPHFTPPGPIYHMLVIKGYTPTEFITNDPGTIQGADYPYSYEVLEESIHDWVSSSPPNEEIKNEKSAMIVIYPN